MKNSNYDKNVSKSKTRLKNLEKILSSEKKDLVKLENNLKAAKKRSSVARTKAKTSSNKSIQDRAKLTIEKEKDLVKVIRMQQQKIKGLREEIRHSKKDLNNLEKQSRLFTKAMTDFEYQWTKLYSDTSKNGKSLTATSSKQDDFSCHVRAARGLLNLSRKDFASLLEVSPELVKQIEQPSKKTIFETHLIKSTYQKIKKAGIEIIPNGFYIGDGGIGVRLKRVPSNSRLSKPKLAKKRTKVVPIKNSRSLTARTRKKAA